MSAQFRLPNVTGGTPEEQIRQLSSFLYQHIQELTWTINNMETGTLTDSSDPVAVLLSNPRKIYSSIKSFILEADEIAKAYLEDITPELNEAYLRNEEFDSFEDELDEYKAGVDAFKKSTATSIANLTTERSQATASGVTWQISKREGKKEMWGLSGTLSFTKGTEKSFTLPESLTIQGISVQPICSDPVTATVTAMTTGSVTIMLSADCEAAISIHVFGG